MPASTSGVYADEHAHLYMSIASLVPYPWLSNKLTSADARFAVALRLSDPSLVDSFCSFICLSDQWVGRWLGANTLPQHMSELSTSAHILANHRLFRPVTR